MRNDEAPFCWERISRPVRTSVRSTLVVLLVRFRGSCAEDSQAYDPRNRTKLHEITRNEGLCAKTLNPFLNSNLNTAVRASRSVRTRRPRSQQREASCHCDLPLSAA